LNAGIEFLPAPERPLMLFVELIRKKRDGKEL
jgi:hypothetical protein